MSTFTPSNDDILTPGSEPSNKNRSPVWAIVTALVAVFCCCCLCMGLLSLWFIRFGFSFLSGLFGGF